MCGVVELAVYRVPVGVVFLKVFCVKFYIILSYSFYQNKSKQFVLCDLLGQGALYRGDFGSPA